MNISIVSVAMINNATVNMRVHISFRIFSLDTQKWNCWPLRGTQESGFRCCLAEPCRRCGMAFCRMASGNGPYAENF